MKILVTGGAGFLGSNLCRRLLKEGNEVICLDNLYTGRKKNIFDLIGNENFQFINGDICEKRIIDVDQVYHLACPASPKYYQHNPINTLKTNVIGTLNVLEMCRETKSKFLITSTSEVYGDPKEHPQKETYLGNVNCVGPRAVYDEGKRCAETLAFEFHKEFNVDAKIVRLFNSYGPGLNSGDGRVVSNFITQAINNNPITIYGDGKQTRSFCYFEDTINGLIAMMNSEHHGPINIGNPLEFTILELAELIIEILNSKSEIIYLDLPKDDPCKRKPDVSMANEILNWSPTFSLKEGLEQTIEHFKREK